MLRYWCQALWALILMASVAHAQFNFFDHMFGGNQQPVRNAGPQNVPSDSNRYQNMWAQCKSETFLSAGRILRFCRFIY